MKISPRKYAISLVEILEESKDISSDVQCFLSLIWKRKQFKSLHKILIAFEEEWNKRKKIMKLDVWYPKRFELTVMALKEVLQKNWDGKINMTLLPEDSLIGGYKIRFADTLIDASVKTQLENFKKKII